MMKIQFGSGSEGFEGWQNYDIDVDITKPLPFPDGCASRIYAGHVIEHLTPAQGWGFIEECYRVLDKGSVVRLAFPDITEIARKFEPIYGEAIKAGGHGDGTKRSAIRATLCCHGHQAIWTVPTMLTVLRAIGFVAVQSAYNNSTWPDLCGLERHGKVVGEKVAEIETSVVDAVKL